MAKEKKKCSLVKVFDIFNLDQNLIITKAEPPPPVPPLAKQTKTAD